VRHPYLLLLVIASTLVLGACGKDESASGSASKTADKTDNAGVSDSGQASTDTNQVATTAQDINPQERGALKGGDLTLSLPSFAENWNPLHVDGNNYGFSRIRAPLLPAFFIFDAAGVPTPNPDYVLSVDVVSDDPTQVRYKLNPDAVWGDGSPVDGDDMVAKWKACNGENTEFSCVSTESYEPIATITTGEDKTDVTVTYKSSFPDWSQGFSAPGVIKAESIMDADVFNTGWSELNNDWLSGPFKVGSFDETQQVMTLIPNDKWWGEPPVLESIVWRRLLIKKLMRSISVLILMRFSVPVELKTRKCVRLAVRISGTLRLIPRQACYRMSP